MHMVCLKIGQLFRRIDRSILHGCLQQHEPCMTASMTQGWSGMRRELLPTNASGSSSVLYSELFSYCLAAVTYDGLDGGLACGLYHRCCQYPFAYGGMMDERMTVQSCTGCKQSCPGEQTL